VGMVALLAKWLISSAAIWLTAELLPGFSVKGFKGALLVALILGLLDALVGWFLFVVIGLGTLGIGFLLAFATRWLVMAILLVVTDKLSDNLKIRSFGLAFVGAIVITTLSALGHRLLA
jgi:putative membrane protein